MESELDKRVGELIENYGNFDFFQQALEKQKVTRRIIRVAKSKNLWTAFFNYMLSLMIIGIGLTGITSLNRWNCCSLFPLEYGGIGFGKFGSEG